MSENLTDFGLTGNQAKVYVALVKLGVASASQIARSSKVRREEVYRLMPKLQQLGLVEKILGKPIKYKSIPPRKGLSILFEREREGAKEKIAGLTEKRRRLLKQLKSVRAKRTIVEEPRFVLISDRNQALSKMVVMIRSAKREIDVVTSEYGLRYGYTVYADPVMKAIRKGVKVRFLSEINEVDELMLKILNEIKLHGNSVEIRYAANLTSSILIVDNSGVFVGIPLKPTMKKHADLWTNSPAYVDAMKTFFNRVWCESVDISSRINYLQTGKPIERTLVFKDPKEAYEKSLELFRSAKEEIIGIGISTRLASYLRSYPFKELQERDVRFRLLVPITKENVNEVKELLKYGELKHAETINTVMGIIDRKHLLLFRTPPSDVPSDPEYKGYFKEMVYTNDRRYLEGMMSIMEQLWNLGVDGRERIMELETGKPIEQTEVIKGRDAIYERGYAVYSRAKTDKLTITDGSGVELSLRDFSSTNIELKKRGVRVRYLTNVTAQNLEIVEEMSKQFEVRHTDNVPFRCTLTETEAMFSWIPVKEMPDETIYSNNAEMVHILWKIAKNAWDNAIDVQSRIDEIKKGKPIGRTSKPLIELVSKEQKTKM